MFGRKLESFLKLWMTGLLVVNSHLSSLIAAGVRLIVAGRKPAAAAL